ncbi:DNA-processing protein DprA [Companilactobacillus sp.]|jgi:DNA processing protein|uniref:DNA-processing protein DprA n=1 Tax=Companilactobacillus sp. TaxID=2767905 RepID=UPI0025C409F9|nr:DNA-processing protein DprA [Companilactobacillus sp.]MCH4008296.1 DNA-processing protein DprA [Companilactobacillus sp.]MCH4051525.1 DNA-processing protein DprA [Companilactobacillus sp.]MCH4076239.1 DNA-processing protein DprA [Companilactobacillus sp.]MCH4124814.1 DNA-processing protein DprA [Companilactobacillus sp.]MCH4131356.1 DNA-processing protein DprA [Companilactobacillus sp.]
MDKLTEFLTRCRLTRQVSNQQMLKIIKFYLESAHFESDALKFVADLLGPQKFNQFLLLFSKTDLMNISAITFLDPSYPEKLRNIYNPPALLFYRGNKNLLLTPCLAIVGSRNASEYSRRCIRGLVPKITGRYTVVSGLAKGVDSWSHQATLDNSGKTIAVIGSSLDVCYPAENKQLQKKISEVGLLLSEYPPGSKINRWHFPQRNRIIAGLSDKVVITEAKNRSGALITAEMALDSNRDVYAIPGPIDSSLSVGCNHLIQQGAIPLINFTEI